MLCEDPDPRIEWMTKAIHDLRGAAEAAKVGLEMNPDHLRDQRLYLLEVRSVLDELLTHCYMRRVA